MTLEFGSLFAGIGGADRGLERAGMSCGWQVEIDKWCTKVLEKHWPNVPKYRDVRDVGRYNLKAVDLIVGGFPCQDLSVAGKRAGLAGTRSSLWSEFRRVIAELSPRWTIIENVPGLLSSNGGRDMGTIVGALAELGYGWAYRRLDAQYYGLAQRRKRIFIVGCFGSPASAAEVLFEPASCAWDSAPSREKRPELATDIGASLKGGSGQRGFPIEWEAGLTTVAATLNSGGSGGGFRTEPGEHLVLVGVSENQRGEVRLTPYSRQLTAGGGKPGQGYPAALTSRGVRRLTPVECERLQGFPDGHTGGQSDAQRYRMLGNAIAVPVAAWIGQRIMMVEANDS